MKRLALIIHLETLAKKLRAVARVRGNPEPSHELLEEAAYQMQMAAEYLKGSTGMIVKLTYTNALSVPILLRNNMGTGQPLAAGQSLEMTFSLEDKEDGIGDLVLICEPQDARG